MDSGKVMARNTRGAKKEDHHSTRQGNRNAGRCLLELTGKQLKNEEEPE
jgi:hypothetical protein